MMIKSLGNIIYKNLKILFRSKFSTVAILLVPFLIIIFSGLAFNSSGLTGVTIGTYSDSYSNLTENILLSFENQDFSVNKFPSLENCINSVKDSQSQICILFPENLNEDGSSEDIVFHVDHSRINLAYSLIHDIESKISSKASELGASLAQEIIGVLELTKNSLSTQIIKLSSSENLLVEISENSDQSIPNSEIEDAIEYLNDAEDLINDSTALTKIQDTLGILESLKNSTSEVSENLENIESDSEEAIFLLNEVYSSLDKLIVEIANKNVLEAEKIVSPIKTKIESINSDSSNKDYLLPTIISLIALFGGILLSSTFILKERKSKAYFRNFITPTGDFTFLLGNYLTCMVILLIQFVLVFIGVEFVLKTPIVGNLGQISLILFVSLSAFVFMGMFIGYLFRSEETTIFASVLIAALLMFFSNTILPIETISSSFKNLAFLNPLVVCDSALKKVILFNLDYSLFLKEVYILAGFLVGFGVLSFFGRRITKRML